MDSLACYGFPGIETPAIDGLARDGLLFEQVTATVPLTFPAHASIFTGRIPPHHGVRDNGGFFLEDSETTLAEGLKQAGYATGAFVAAWVLESRWGLAQGFDSYSDRFDLSQYKVLSLGTVQKQGDEVMNDALTWLETVKERKFFAWVHLYDPHAPYEPHEPFTSRYPDQPYLGEVAYTDHVVGRLLESVISADVQQNFTRLASGILKRTAENSAAILELSKKSFELALFGLALEADAVFAEDPPGRVKVYFASDFDDPATAPPGAGPQPGYVKKSAADRLVNDIVSFEHPSVLLSPGVSPSDAADDVARLSLLADTFVEISAKLGPVLHWVYVSSESGVHVSYPGHGGYPEGYDPRQRPWYMDATDETRWSQPLVDASTGQVIMTLSKRLRYPDGKRAGVAAMDVLLTEVWQRRICRDPTC